MLFFFNNTATTEIYPLSLHDALPISPRRQWSECVPMAGALPRVRDCRRRTCNRVDRKRAAVRAGGMESRRSVRPRSEEHTSELQSRQYLVCRLLLEKKTSLPSATFRT